MYLLYNKYSKIISSEKFKFGSDNFHLENVTNEKSM